MTVQLRPGASEVPQLLVWMKILGSVAICWMLRVALEALARVTGAVPELPTATLPKFTRMG